MTSPTYRANGQQVLRDDATGSHHFADACNPDAAAALVTILNHATLEFPADPAAVSDAEIALVEEVLR